MTPEESAFLHRKASNFTEWLDIGEPCSMARIRECRRRFRGEGGEKDA